MLQGPHVLRSSLFVHYCTPSSLVGDPFLPSPNSLCCAYPALFRSVPLFPIVYLTQILSPPVTILVTMLFDVLTVSFALHLLVGDFALALPSSPRSPSSPSRSLHIPLLRRAVPQRNDTELGLWAKQQKQSLESKYGGSSTTKRSSGTNLCV
jgi:hypothetical protein